MLKFKDINKLNEANIVLRHFVDLSAQLLPFLDELYQKNILTNEEALNKTKIISVFESYNFDTKTSELLINSNILELIKSSFLKISNSNENYDNRAKKRTLREFLFEHHRLVESWNYVDSN